MSTDGQSEKLRNGLILYLESSMNEILQGIGEIRSDLKRLRQDSEQHSKDLKKTDSRFSAALKRTDERINHHLRDHSENIEFMGIAPYFRKYGKKHWKTLFGGILIVQIALAGLIMKYGIEKIINIFAR
jgi:hypothetical protein